MDQPTTPILPPPPPLIAPARSQFRKIGAALGSLAFTLLLSAATGFFGALYLPSPQIEPKTILIPKGAGLRGMGALLEENGLIYHAWQFIIPARLIAPQTLRAGEYAFTPGMSVAEMIALLRSGKTVIHKLTIPEGLTSGDIVALLDAEEALDGPIAPPPPEGSLLPETLYFSRGDKRNDLIARMQKLRTETLQRLWNERADGLPLATQEQALVLASIVEKETGLAAERPRVAGVFVNRLRAGMKLQSDPTVIYGLMKEYRGKGRDLTRADLAAPTLYNTYVIDGLPPGPIANPGRAAIEAVLHPEQHSFYYFVADGSGGHAFARTLDEHHQNVARWRKLSRQAP